MAELKKEITSTQDIRCQRAAAVTKQQIELARLLANEAFPGAGDNSESPLLAAILTALASNYHATVLSFK